MVRGGAARRRFASRNGKQKTLPGRLAELLALAQKKPALPKEDRLECMPAMVAGVGFEPTTFRL